jgi:hypothetical protein
MYPSPWLPEGGTTLGSFDYRMGVEGFFLISEYVQEHSGRATFHGHGVYGWDIERERYTMLWFDSMGGVTPRTPTLGTWKDETLVFIEQTSRGHTRFRHELLARDRYSFHMDRSDDGQRWSPLMEGRYARKG